MDCLFIAIEGKKGGKNELVLVKQWIHQDRQKINKISIKNV